MSSAGGGVHGVGGPSEAWGLGHHPPLPPPQTSPRLESTRRAGAVALGWDELGTHPALWGGGGATAPCSPQTSFLGGHPAPRAPRMAPSSKGCCRAGTAGGTLPPGCSHFGCRAPHTQGAAAPAPSWAWSTAVHMALRGRSDPHGGQRRCWDGGCVSCWVCSGRPGQPGGGGDSSGAG